MKGGFHFLKWTPQLVTSWVDQSAEIRPIQRKHGGRQDFRSVSSCFVPFHSRTRVDRPVLRRTSGRATRRQGGRAASGCPQARQVKASCLPWWGVHGQSVHSFL